MIKLILCLTAAIKLASAQYNGIIWDAEPQYQPQYSQQVIPQVQSDKNREAADEPIVGSPLLPILPLGLGRIGGLGGLGGLPGLRFSNLNAGHFGGLMYGNSLLGAPNPMADEQAEAQYADPQVASQYQAAEYQVDPQISAQADTASYGHGGKWWWKKWANDDQSGSVVGASPCSCAQSYQNFQVASPQSYEFASPQSYSGYEAAPQNYEVAARQSYEVAAPQNYQPYQQQIYSAYQSPLPQIITDYQPSPAQGYRAQYDHQQIQPQPAGPIVQPAGTYESSEKSASEANADERSWDWSWKDDKKAAKFDKFHSKKDKFNKGGHAHIHVHPEPHYHQPSYHQPTYYHQPQYHAYTKPVYTKPAPAAAQPVQYNNYYNGYRARNMEAEKPLDSEVKTEVGKDEILLLPVKKFIFISIPGQSQDLKITTTEASSNKTTTSASCYSPNELTTKTQSTTSTDERSANVVSTTTEKSKKKSKKSSRRRREVPSPSTNSKRCITFTDPIFLGLPLSGSPFSGIPLLGAPNPNAAADDSTQDLVSNPSENCESGNCSNPTDSPQPIETTQPPPSRFLGALGPDRTQQLFRATFTEPYLGAVQQENNKLWNNDALMGRIMGQVEDTYLDFVKHNENLPRIQDIRVIT
ncbi:hypothetical protein ACKWTF_009628 [Chironomus riparius]